MFYDFILVSHLLIALANFSLAGLLLYKDVHNRAYVYLSIAAIFNGVFPFVIVLQTLGIQPLLMARLTWLNLVATPFFLLFMERLFGRLSRLEKPVAILILVFWVSMVLLNVFSPFHTSERLVSERPYFVLETGSLDLPSRVALAATVMYMLSVYIIHFIRSSGAKRKKAKYFLAGLTIYGLGSIFLNALLSLAFGLQVTAAYFIPFLSFIWVLLTFYAVTRDRFLDIETAFHKTLAWLVFSAVFIIPVHAFIVLNRGWLDTASNEVIAGVTLVIFFLTYLYFKHIQPRIDQVFQKRKYDLLRLSNDFSEQLAGLGTERELESLTASVLKDKLYASRARLVLLEGRKGPACLKAGKTCERKGMLLVPITHKGKLIAYLELGKKANLKAYTGEDMDFLSSIAGSLSVAIMNTLLYKDVRSLSRNLERKVKERTRELTEKNEELEKFKGFSVGREMKMIELKKELKRLKNK